MSSTLHRCVVFGTLICFALAPAATAQTVRGNVRLASGNAPAAYAIVAFTQGGREKARTITDPDGFYYIRNLPAGSYEVRILRQKSVETKNVQVPAAGGTIDFTVR
jgi:hypothetical protein